MFATYRTHDNQLVFGFDNNNGTVLLYYWDDTKELVDSKAVTYIRPITIMATTIQRLITRTAFLKQSFSMILDRAIETNKSLTDITLNLDISKKIFYIVLECFECKEKWSAYAHTKKLTQRKQFHITANSLFMTGKNREVQSIQVS